MDTKTSMRDAIIDELYHLSEQDKDIVIVSADMGAPALDRYRRDRNAQYINVGIAEQSMINIAAGLAKEGKRPFTFCIAPFATSRVHEFIKINAGVMKLPFNILAVGAGFSYEDSGPTHHTTEDIAILSPIPHLEIYSPSDSIAATALVKQACYSNSPTYHRLDRQVQPQIYSGKNKFERGFEKIDSDDSNKKYDVAIIATGNIVHNAIKAKRILASKKIDISVIDIYRIKPFPKELSKTLSQFKYIVSLEEHLLRGGLGSILAEIICDEKIPVRLKRLGIDNEYPYAYGRESIQHRFGLDSKFISKTIEYLLKE